MSNMNFSGMEQFRKTTVFQTFLYTVMTAFSANHNKMHFSNKMN